MVECKNQNMPQCKTQSRFFTTSENLNISTHRTATDVELNFASNKSYFLL